MKATEQKQTKLKTKTTFSDLIKVNPISLKFIKRGDIIEGSIVKVMSGLVLVDLGYKSEGFISGSELRSPGLSVKSLKVGEKLTLFVLNPENDKGQLELSLRRTEDIRKWNKLEQAWENNEIIEVVVVDYNTGGVLVDIESSLSGFVPISQLDFSRIYKDGSIDNNIAESLNAIIGEKLLVKVIELDKTKDRIILSEKLALSNENIQLRTETLKNIKVNDVIEGVVTSVTPYGIFVTAQGLEGLVHLSEISWDKVSDPNDFYKVGDEVKVQLISMRDDGKRVAYSIKRLQQDTWDSVISNYKVGQIVKGTVQKIVDYGVFVRIADGVNGLIHISELSDKPVEDISKVVSLDDELELKVLSISPIERHLGLSLKKAKDKDNKK